MDKAEEMDQTFPSQAAYILRQNFLLGKVS